MKKGVSSAAGAQAESKQEANMTDPYLALVMEHPLLKAAQPI